jgi:hypothetical protein
MSNEALLDFLQSDSSVWARIAEPPESDAA